MTILAATPAPTATLTYSGKNINATKLAFPSGENVDYIQPTGLFINNEFVPSVSGKMFDVVNPSNGELICKVAEADKEDVDVAVINAQKAFKTWKTFPAADRGKLLYRLAGLIERDADILARIESLDNGKPLNVAKTVDLTLVIDCFRYYAGWSDKIHGQVMDNGNKFLTMTKRVPVGVCGQIIPWNFPLLMAAWKLGPALACGNVCIVKTSEKTPLSALYLAKLIVEAGFPAGVVQILSGFGPTAGSAMASHMDIQKIAFTGSTFVGRKVMEAAANSNLKKVSLELGGKSPNIVFDDANLDQAVAFASIGLFFNHGQTCCAGTRIFVQEGIYDRFVEKFRLAAEAIKVGNPHEDATQLGPLVDKIQFEKVLGYIEAGKSEGATLLHGGVKMGDNGFFVSPTLFTDVTDDMKISKEEIFGPVGVIMKFKTIDEVVERANDTAYGLAASVHTTNNGLANQMVDLLDAGTCWVNCHNILLANMPFGGFKSSGIGRELGEEALHEYTECKSIIMNIA